jgi:uncharacterized protein YqgC (DUF456 family)
MSFEQIVGLILALLVMLIGLVGAVLPGLPGTPLLLAAALLHKLYFGEAGAAWWVLAVMALLAAVSFTLEYLATVYGAKRLGATWRGMVGAILGGIFGLLLSPAGFLLGVFFILLGPFVGASLLEMTGRRPWREATKAGLGATIGLLAGTAGKFACGVAMIGLFTLNVIYRSLQ